MAFNTSRFLDLVKLKGAIPTGRLSDSEILEVAYDVLLAEVQPLLISLREEYYVSQSSTSVVSGTANYPINPLALGLVLRELKLTVDGTIYDLERIDPITVNDSNSGIPTKFWLQGESIVLYPTPSVSGTLTQSFFRRINKPVEISSTAAITQINTVSGVVTATPVTGWTTTNTFDLISRNNGNAVLASGLTATAVGSSDITFTASDLPAALAVGDYIALVGESPYIQVPDDAIPLVQHMTVRDILESMGDAAGMQAAMAKIDRITAAIGRIMSDRVFGAQIKFKPQF
jgi:hypothetical protein